MASKNPSPADRVGYWRAPWGMTRAGLWRLPYFLTLLLSLVLALLLGVASPARAAPVISPVQIDARLSFGFVDNVGQAQRGRDIIDDEYRELELGAGYDVALLNGRLDASVRGFVTARDQTEIEALGQKGGGVELGLNWRLGNSPLPPFVRLQLRAEGENYDFKQRDSDIYTGSLEVGANFGPRTVLSVGGEYRDRQARSDVFDIEQWSAFLNASLDIGDAWQLGLRVEHVDGDVWSSVLVDPPGDEPPVDDIFNLIAAAGDNIQRDDAFNDAFDSGWFVYRLPAERQEYSLSLSRSIAQRLAVRFEWLEVRVKGERDNDYDNRVLQLSLGFQL